MTSEPTRFIWSGERTIDQIEKGVVSSNARFVFDKPVTVLRNEAIEMRDGQFFLVSAPFGVEVYYPLSGKWDR